jgi:hypothetical protein
VNTGHIPRPQGDLYITDITKKTGETGICVMARFTADSNREDSRAVIANEGHCLGLSENNRIKAKALSEQVRTLAQQQAERYSQQD